MSIKMIYKTIIFSCELVECVLEVKQTTGNILHPDPVVFVLGHVLF